MIYQKKMYVLLSINFTFIECETIQNYIILIQLLNTEKPVIHFTNKIL